MRMASMGPWGLLPPWVQFDLFFLFGQTPATACDPYEVVIIASDATKCRPTEEAEGGGDA